LKGGSFLGGNGEDSVTWCMGHRVSGFNTALRRGMMMLYPLIYAASRSLGVLIYRRHGMVTSSDINLNTLLVSGISPSAAIPL
jgi:hypothetical protein